MERLLFLLSGLFESKFIFSRIIGKTWMPLSVALLLSLATVSGQEATYVFVPPAQPLTAGKQASLWLYCMNNSTQAITNIYAPSLPCRLVSTLRTNETILTLSASNPPAMIAPGAFAKAEYHLDIPANVQGQASFNVSNYSAFTIPVIAATADAPFMAEPESSSPPLDTASVSSLIGDFYDKHLFRYEPIYFLLGNYPAAKFQLSLKYRLFSYSENWNPFNHLYFGYTQTSYWDLISADPSFFDTSYKPSGFLYYRDVLPHKFPLRLDLQGGFEHESNGRGGPTERSLNTVYFQPTVSYAVTTNLQVMFQPRGWYYISKGSYNQDLAEYRGYVDLLAAVTWDNKAKPWQKTQLAGKLRLGEDGRHPGVEVDLRFNLPRYFGFNPTVEVEYFSGYGQTLRQYNELSHGLRAGLCLWY